MIFRLPPGPWPASVDQLRQHLIDGLQCPPNALTVSGQWPELTHFAWDLSGSGCEPGQPLHRPGPAVERGKGPVCQALKIWAAPFRLGDFAHPHFQLDATDLQFEFIRDNAGVGWLTVVHVGSASAKVWITEKDLNALFLDGARRLSAANGILVENVSVKLRPAGRRTVQADAEIGARKSFLKGCVCLSGTLELDSSFNLHLCDLKCKGVGPVGAIASRMIQPALDRLGQTLSLQKLAPVLFEFALDELSLTNLNDGALAFDAKLVASPR